MAEKKPAVDPNKPRPTVQPEKSHVDPVKIIAKTTTRATTSGKTK